MSLLDSEFRVDRLNVHNLKLNGIDISNFQIETLGDGKYIDSLRGDIQVQITPSILDANGNYVIQQIPGLGRFARAEVSSTPRAIYYLAPNGSDSNLGTKVSPWRTLTNVPNGSIVVLLNGTYSGYNFFYGNYSSMSCFFSTTNKSNLIIIGESKDGVIINRVDSPNSGDYDAFVCDKLYSTEIFGMKFNIPKTRGINSTIQYYISASRVTFHNIDITIAYDSIGSYYNMGSSIYNNCTITGGTKQVWDGTPATTIQSNILLYPFLGITNSNIGINGVLVSPNNVLDINNIVFTKLIDFKSNTLTFNTDKRNFDTITLNIWLEQ